MLCALPVSAAFSAEDKPLTPLADVKMSEASVRDQVKIMRSQRYSEMPYLDKKLIDSMIRPEKVREKLAFAAGGSKGLGDIVDRAISVYTPARASRERISLSRRRILAAVRNLFPEVNYEFQDKKGVLGGDKYNSNSWRFNTRLPIFHGGVLWNTLLQEKLGLESAEKEYEAVLEDLVKDVAEAYFEYHRALLAEERKAAAVEELRPQAEISGTKYKEELISEIEHLNVQSLFSQLRFEHETAKQEMELSKLELQRFLDLDGEADLDITALYDVEEIILKGNELEPEEQSPDAVPGSPAVDEAVFDQDVESFLGQAGQTVPALDSLVDMAYMNRARLRVEAAKLQAARLGERIRWGNLLPQVDVILEFGKLGEAFDIDNVDPGLRKEFKFGLEMNWNFAGSKVGYTYDNDERAPTISQFLSQDGSRSRKNLISVGVLDGLGDWTAVKEAEIAKLDQIVALEKAEKEVVRDVKQAYYDYQKARIQVKSAVQRANYRRRQAQFNKHRMEKNEIQISEYLTSEIDYVQESLTLHKALADYFVARAKINHAIGRRDFLPVEERNAN